MEATKLWLIREDVMLFEDEMEGKKLDIDSRKNDLLGDDDLLEGLVKDHNDLAAIFEVIMTEATSHLKEKMNEITEKKKQIQIYSNYVMINDNQLADITKDFLETKQQWKTAITEYTVGLDKFVESGEVKDV